MLLCVILLALYALTTASAHLTLYHGRVTSQTVTVDQVEGVAVLNLGGPTTTHFFDCHTVTGNANDLTWSREGGLQRFTTSTANIIIDDQTLTTLRIDMTDVGYKDIDVYSCTNGETGESISINITGAAQAVNSVQPSYEVNLNGTAELRVYAAGVPPLLSSEVVWRTPNAEVIASNGRITLHDMNTRLVIRNVGLKDSGTYTVGIVKEVTLSLFRTFDTTITDLNVYVGSMVVLSPISVEISEHNAVTFTCVVTGNPSPDVVWEREGLDPLPVLTRRNITETAMKDINSTLYTVTSNLTIHDVLFEDRGRYRCVATNIVAGGEERADSSTLAQLTVPSGNNDTTSTTFLEDSTTTFAPTISTTAPTISTIEELTAISTTDHSGSDAPSSVAVIAGAVAAGVLCVLILIVLIVLIAFIPLMRRRTTSQNNVIICNTTNVELKGQTLEQNDTIPAQSVPVETNAAYISTPSIPVEANTAYISTPSVTMEANQCYGTSADSDHLYATPRGEEEYISQQQATPVDYDYI